MERPATIQRPPVLKRVKPDRAAREVPQAVPPMPSLLARQLLAGPLGERGGPVRGGLPPRMILTLQRTIGNRATGALLARARRDERRVFPVDLPLQRVLALPSEATGPGSLVALLPALPEPLRPIVDRIVAAVRAGKLKMTPPQLNSLLGLLRDLIEALRTADPAGPAVSSGPGTMLPGGMVALSEIVGRVLGVDVTAILGGNDLFLSAEWLAQHPIDVTGVFGDESGPPAMKPESLESAEDVRTRTFEEFAARAGERATAEAQSVTLPVHSPRQKKRLERVLGQKQAIGPRENIVDYFKEQEEQEAKARQAELEKRLKQQQALADKFKEQREAHQKRQQKEKAAAAQAAQAAEAKRQSDIRANEFAIVARPVREVAQKLLDRLAAAHDLVKEELNTTATTVKKVTDRANEALAAVALGETEAKRDGPSLQQAIARVKPFQADLDTMLKDVDQAKGSVERKRQDKANSTLTYLQQKGLTAMLAYNAPALRQAKQAVDDAVSAGQWYTIDEKVAALTAEVNKIEPSHRLIVSLEQRVTHLTGKGVNNANFNTVRDELAQKNTIEADKLPEYARRLDNTLWDVQRPIAQAAFDAVSGNDAQANATLENLLATGMIARGQFNKKYRTSWDTQGGFSVEYTIKGINNIVIHAHCTKMGTPKPGNGSHWKYKSEKYSPGASHEISDTLRAQLIDVNEAKSKPITKE